ncbi:MAG: DUF4384 domain-containing protein [Gemmatimonadales bacterium]
MLATFAGLMLLTGIGAPGSPGPDLTPADRIAAWVRATDDPRITIWTNREEDPYRRGERARVYFQALEDGYITVLRVDTDGRVRVLFPREPWEDNFARGGRTFEVLDRDDEAFEVDDEPGVGYLFAISSPDPYDYGDFIRGDHWDYRTIADGRVRGDPYVSLTEFAAQIVGPGEYDYDIAPYYVEQHYDYPRFVCYDCHNYVSYAYWDPYRTHCNRFRIVIYDDYYYYPYRYYGSRVVIRRPIRPGPRYVFKDYDGRRDFITRVRERPADDGRRISERDRTSADVGGRGSVPAPVEPRRRPAPQDRNARPDDPTPRRRADQPADRGTTRPDRPSAGEPRRRTGETRSQATRDRADPPSLRERPGVQEPRRRSSDSRGSGSASPDRSGADSRRRTSSAAPMDLQPSTRMAPDRPDTDSRRRFPGTDSGRQPSTRSSPVWPGATPADPRRAETGRSGSSSRSPAARPDTRRAQPRSTPSRAQPRSTPSKPTGAPTLRRRKGE